MVYGTYIAIRDAQLDVFPIGNVLLVKYHYTDMIPCWYDAGRIGKNTIVSKQCSVALILVAFIVTFDNCFPNRYYCSWLLLLGIICANVLYFVHTLKMCH